MIRVESRIVPQPAPFQSCVEWVARTDAAPNAAGVGASEVEAKAGLADILDGLLSKRPTISITADGAITLR